ncbi:MAG: hypothetical protein K5873_09145 [Treponema sp.]|nr:hypothetical protein [Treponema sp.]
MSKSRIFSSAFFAISFLGSLSAQELSFSGNLTAQAGVGMPSTHENKGHFLVGTTAFDSTIKSYTDDSTLFVNSQLVYDALSGQSSNGREAFVSDDGTFAFKLKEAYFDYNGGFFAVRAGRQIAAWGKADSIQIADILCPQDNSSLIASNYKESRLGIDALRLSFIQNSMQLDAYWIPFFTPSTLPLAKGNPLNSVIFPKSYEGYEIISPTTWSDFDLPEKKLSNSEYALRLSSYFSKFDLSFYGFYGWEDTPFFEYEPNFTSESENADFSSLNLKGTYKRLLMFGADAAIPFGAFVFRLESAFFPGRYIQTSADYQKSCIHSASEIDSALKRNQIVGLVGFDWDAGSGWSVMAQYVADYAAGSVKELDRKAYLHQATLTLSKSLLNELLSLSLHSELDLCDFSSFIEPEVDYSLTDSITVSLIGDFYLEGLNNEKGMYGIYRDLSCITLKGKISF